MKSIDRLLKKKGWTGKELGKILIASMLNDIQFDGDPAKALFSQADFERMESTLSTERDYLEYNVYSTLYNALTDGYNRGQGVYQQFYNGFGRLMSTITECYHAEQATKALNNTPLIMTEVQYNRLRSEARQTLEACKESFCSLLFGTLEYFLEHEEEATQPIKDALEATRAIDAKGNTFLSRYNETYGEGYYQLPDGTRSDKLTDEDWQKALVECRLKPHKPLVSEAIMEYFDAVEERNHIRLINLYGLIFNGESAVKDFYLSSTGEELPDEEVADLMDALEALANGEVKSNLYLSKLLPYLDYADSAEWHFYEAPPEGLTLYDLLEMYVKASNGSYTDLDEKKALKLLKKDAPDLYKAIKGFIEERVDKARGLKPNQLYKKLISWGELAKLQYLDYEELVDPEDEDIIDAYLKGEDSTRSKSYRERVSANGIAVIRKPSLSQVDAEGNYIEDRTPLHFFHTLDEIAEDEDTIVSLSEYSEELFKPALRYIYAYNTLLGLIGKEYDLPDLQEVASLDTSFFEYKIFGYNGFLYTFYIDLYGSTADVARKRAIIKDLFKPVDIEELKPTQDAIDEVDASLRSLGVTSKVRKHLRTLDAYIDRLCNGLGA